MILTSVESCGSSKVKFNFSPGLRTMPLLEALHVSGIFDNCDGD